MEERSSRIVKLFIDTLTSKGDNMAIIATELMGSTYEKLLAVIMRKEEYCLAFWKAVVELSQNKNETILNNFIYSLPGILTLAAPLHKVDPLCDVYVELFYSPIANKLTLASYYHEMAQLFPSKADPLKDLLYGMLNELFEDPEPEEESIRVIHKIMSNLAPANGVFLMTDPASTEPPQYFESPLCDYLIKYLNFLLTRKISKRIEAFLLSITECYKYFSAEFIEVTLAPRLYACLKNKLSNPSLLVELIVKLITRDFTSALINSYLSKAAIDLGRSSRSFERESALLFFYHCKSCHIQAPITLASRPFRSTDWVRNTFTSTTTRHFE